MQPLLPRRSDPAGRKKAVVAMASLLVRSERAVLRNLAKRHSLSNDSAVNRAAEVTWFPNNARGSPCRLLRGSSVGGQQAGEAPHRRVFAQPSPANPGPVSATFVGRRTASAT